MSDSENTSLMSDKAGDFSKKKLPPPDWGKFGLSQEPVKASYSSPSETGNEGGYQHTDSNNKNELFQEDQVDIVHVPYFHYHYSITCIQRPLKRSYESDLLKQGVS